MQNLQYKDLLGLLFEHYFMAFCSASAMGNMV